MLRKILFKLFRPVGVCLFVKQLSLYKVKKYKNLYLKNNFNISKLVGPKT